MNVKNKFLKYYHRKQTQINEGHCDISTDEEGVLGFWQLRLAKSEHLSVLQHLPNRHIENHELKTMGSCWNKHTLRADRKLAPEDLQRPAGKHFSGFSVWEVSPKEDTTVKYFVFFQAKQQTLGS